MWPRILAYFTDGPKELKLKLRQSNRQRSTWGEHALDVAKSCLGMGEEGGNNLGPDIEIFRRGRKLRSWQRGEWCASFASYITEEGWARTHLYTNWAWPKGTLKKRCPVKRTPNAKKLATRIAAAGCAVDAEILEPGDFALWKRKGGHHIGIVSQVREGIFFCIEGNKGRYNKTTGHGSKVREFKHEFGEPHLLMFVRLP